MTTFEQLLPASFRGVSFLVPNESKSGGKKTVDHSYPGSNKRFVEELGAQPSTHSISAIIHGGDAIQQRARLEKELLAEGRGLLIHPSLGQIMVTAIDFTSRSSDTDIGKFEFDITFAEGDANVSLSAGVPTPQSISSLVAQAQEILDQSFASKYVNVTIPDTILSAANQIEDILDDVSGIPDHLDSISDVEQSILNSEIGKIGNNLKVIARNGSDVISSVRSVYNALNNVGNSVSEYYSSWKSLSFFGDDRTSKQLITQKRIDEENNLLALEDHTRANALLGLYESASYREYKTDVELLTAQEEIEKRFEDIVENSNDGSIVRDSNFRSTITDVRTRVRQILEEQKSNTWRVVGINPGEGSVLLTTHRYYGTDENIQEILNLNPDINASIDDQDMKGIS